MKLRFCVAGIVLLTLAVSSVFAQITPPAPTNLTVTFESPSPNTFGDVKLEWQMAAGQWQFRVYRSAVDTMHCQPIAITPARLYRDFAVVRGTRYYYYVRAMVGGIATGEGPRSNVVSILIPTPPPPVRGFITGVVKDDSTHVPLRARISFYRMSPFSTPQPIVMTDSLGHYQAALDTGRYIARADAMCSTALQCYYAEYFDNAPDPSHATVITVGDSTIFTANFGLRRIVPPTYANLRGTVLDTLDHPLARPRVSILRTMQEMSAISANGGTIGSEENMVLDGVGYTVGVAWSGYTDSLGRYTAHVITGRDYVAMASKDGFIPEYYDNKPTPQLADIIHFTHDTSGIDFSLSVRLLPQNSVAGTIRDSLSHGVPSRVYLYPARVPFPSATPVQYVHTDSLGNYLFARVIAGKYFVSAYPFQGFGPAYYKAGTCGVNRRDQADTVNVAGNITGINICVRALHGNGLGRISGTIRTTASALLRGTVIITETEDGTLAGLGVSDAAGAYTIDALPSGMVTLTADRDGYADATTSLVLNPTILSLDNVNITMSPSGVTSVDQGNGIPSAFALEQNYPNPFNPTTQIKFHLASPGLTTLEVFNLIGQKVATIVNGNLPAGNYTFTLDAKGLSSGMYFYTLRSGSFVATKKMVLMR